MNRNVLGALSLAGILCATQAQAENDSAALSRDEMSWQVRAALNVAALGCRDAAEEQTIASYNYLLARHRAALAAADTGVKAKYRALYGKDWETWHDRDMTRLYNFFAQPTGHDGLCTEAQALLDEAQQVEPEDFADFAANALPRLRTPFEPPAATDEVYRLTETAALQMHPEMLPGE